MPDLAIEFSKYDLVAVIVPGSLIMIGIMTFFPSSLYFTLHEVFKTEAAYLFMQWATSKKVQIELARIGMVPARHSSYLDPEVRKISFFYPATLAALEISNYRPRIPEWEEMNSKMMLALSQALAGEKTSKETLDWLQKEYLKILGK